MTHNTSATYQAPEIEILDVAVENGFAYSLENPSINDEIEW